MGSLFQAQQFGSSPNPLQTHGGPYPDVDGPVNPPIDPTIPDPSPGPGPDPNPPLVPPTPPIDPIIPDPALPGEGSQPVDPFGTDLEDLYGDDAPIAGGPGTPTIEDPSGADVTETDPSVAEVGTPGIAEADPTGALSEAEGAIGEQSGLTPEQQADAELARITGQDSPLMARARAEAAQFANRRGLTNTSMAAGMAQGAMVDRAMPMAMQNASQAFQRELANTGFRQEAGIFTASEQNRLNALEAELGTSVSVFNAEQLNQAESLAAQMRTALEQQDTEAYNRAAMQLADLQRNAQAQQADIDFAAEQQRSAEQQAYNQQIMDRVTQLNHQYLRGSQAMDLVTIQGTYQQIISTNAVAGQLYQSYFNGIAGVMDNPDMTPMQIATAVENMQAMLEASLRMIAEMNDMDFDVGEGIPPEPEPPSDIPPFDPFS